MREITRLVVISETFWKGGTSSWEQVPQIMTVYSKIAYTHDGRVRGIHTGSCQKSRLGVGGFHAIAPMTELLN